MRVCVPGHHDVRHLGRNRSDRQRHELLLDGQTRPRLDVERKEQLDGEGNVDGQACIFM